MEQTFSRKAQEAAGLPVGAAAPRFEATDQHDKPYSLPEALENGPVVLIFYRGQWCPFCNAHLRKLQDELPRLYERGASVAAISPETSPFLRRMMEKTDAEFTLLYDEDYRIAKAYDVVFRPGRAHRFMYNTVLGADMKNAHADERELLPIPATYVIGRDGRILWRHFDPDYKKRSKMDDIVAVLDQPGL
jgi:peroxiredoxin